MPAIREIITISPIADEPDYLALGVVPPSTEDWGPDEHFALYLVYTDSSGSVLSGGSADIQLIQTEYAPGNSTPVASFPIEDNPFSVGPYMQLTPNTANSFQTGDVTGAPFDQDVDMGPTLGGHLGVRVTNFQSVPPGATQAIVSRGSIPTTGGGGGGGAGGQGSPMVFGRGNRIPENTYLRGAGNVQGTVSGGYPLQAGGKITKVLASAQEGATTSGNDTPIEIVLNGVVVGTLSLPTTTSGTSSRVSADYSITIPDAGGGVSMLTVRTGTYQNSGNRPRNLTVSVWTEDA